MPLLSSTLLYCRSVYIGIKQSRQDNIMWDSHTLPSFRDISYYPNADSISTSDMACRKVSTGNCCKICQGITSLRSGCTLALSPAQ